MWAATFFARSMWPGTYWPPVQAATVTPPSGEPSLGGGKHTGRVRRIKIKRDYEELWLDIDDGINDLELVALIAALRSS